MLDGLIITLVRYGASAASAYWVSQWAGDKINSLLVPVADALFRIN